MNRLLEQCCSPIGLLLAFGSAAMPSAAAQDPVPVVVPVARPVPRFDPSKTLSALAERVRNTPVADHTVASSSWLSLAFLENGSTMRLGDHRQDVRLLAKTLLEMQDASGQFTRNGQACSRSDQILGALALLVAYERSQHRPLKKPALKACEVVLATKGPDAAVSDDALVTLLLPTLSKVAKSEPDARESAQLDWLGHQLNAMATEALASRTFGKTRPGDAALHLGQLVLGAQFPPESSVARTWPANLTTDPLHTLFAMLAVSKDEKSLARQSKEIEDLLAARGMDGSSAGMWPAAAGLDETTTTAMLAVSVGIANGSPLLMRPK